jgi:hypothetical protein
MLRHKSALQDSLPFAMDPAVYDFSINEDGTTAKFLTGTRAMMPEGYYRMIMPSIIRDDVHRLPPSRRREVEEYGRQLAAGKSLTGSLRDLVEIILPKDQEFSGRAGDLEILLAENGFDTAQHERIRSDLRSGLIGLAKNRLITSTAIEDALPEDLHHAESGVSLEDREVGLAALRKGEVAVVTLAAGAASRWTEGAGVVKALHPFCRFVDRHRTFLEVHLAKTRKTGTLAGVMPIHVITTSYITDDPIRSFLEREQFYGMADTVRISRGRSVGLRMIPNVRDLKFEWQETAQQILDERAQKMRESTRAALLDWAREAGEASDYRDNLPLQCLHPVGHWFEIPNLLINGTLATLISERPGLRTLLLHNIDTLGANLDPRLLGIHRRDGSMLSFEVIRRRLEDRGGGLARVNGQLRLVEGLALPREEDEFNLSYYNTNSCWIDIDQLLSAFGLGRSDLGNRGLVAEKVREFGQRMHTYVTLKEVKKRWGHGQEDIFPVAQFEKLWGDMTAIDGISSSFSLVPRMRGQQLKEQAQLDAWLRDGSHAFVDALCEW